MKKYLISILALASLNSFAQRASSTACSAEVLSGNWKHAYADDLTPTENIITIDLSNSVNPLVMNLNEYNKENGELFFVYKSIYTTFNLNQKFCTLQAHLDETQSLYIDEATGEISGTSDYNEADQIHLIKIEMLSDKKMKLMNCGADSSCSYSEVEEYEKQ